MLCSIEKDNWLSSQIGKVSYKLVFNEPLIESNKNEIKYWIIKNQNKEIFIYSKIPTKSAENVALLEAVGFKLIDTNVKFELDKELITTKNSQRDIRICFAKKMHKKYAGNIAKNNFIYSRFHLDPLIDNDIANRIKQSWVENFFLGKRGDQMALALINNEPIGFLQLIIKNRTLFIDLIGVDQKAQGNGVASAMIQFADQNIKHTCIKVGTQIGNLPSIRLYHKLGFEFTGSDYVFHYHS